MDVAQKEKDFKLTEQLKNGSKEAFHSVFDTYGPKIHAFALSYLKNEADSEELLQDVFLKLWEVRADLDSYKNIKSFLFKICINLIYDLIRRKNIHQAYLDYIDANKSSSDDNTWQDIVYNEMLNNLKQIVDTMPEQRQHIFRLSKEQGLSNQEIAIQLNLSQRTVENQLYRAVTFLRQKLGTNSLPALLFFFLHYN